MTFHPCRWLAQGHLQTLWPALRRRIATLIASLHSAMPLRLRGRLAEILERQDEDLKTILAWS